VPVVLFVGRLQPLKGLDTLLRAVHLVRQQSPTLQVLIVGGGVGEGDPHEAEELGRLRGLAEHLALTPHLAFIKAQPQETLAQYYASGCVCHPLTLRVFRAGCARSHGLWYPCSSLAGGGISVDGRP